jgi:hypothetical protein
MNSFSPSVISASYREFEPLVSRQVNSALTSGQHRSHLEKRKPEAGRRSFIVPDANSF